MYLDRDIRDSQRYKSHNNEKKEKPTNHRRRNGESVATDPSSSRSDSSDEHEQEPSFSSEEQIHHKKKNKNSSRKVVIRNINYIASGRNKEGTSDSDSCSSDEDEYVDADSLKQQVEAAVGSMKNHKPASGKHKKASNKTKNDLDIEDLGTHNSGDERNGNWDIFQNLLLKDSDSNSTGRGSKTLHVQEEYSFTDKKSDKPKYASDDFLFTERSSGNGIEETGVKFGGGESIHGIVKRSKDEELLIPPRAEGEYNYSQNAHFGTESSIIKTQKEEDWITGNKREMSANLGGTIDHNILNGDQEASADHFQIGHNKREIILDDSFMVQSRLSDETQAKPDIIMVSDIVGSNQSKDSVAGDLRVKVETSTFYEPEALYMMRRNDSWSPEMDYGKDIGLVETVISQSKTEQTDSADATVPGNGKANNTKTGKETRRKVSGKEPKSKAPSGYLSRSKSEIPSRSKISSAGSSMNRSKAEKVSHVTFE